MLFFFQYRAPDSTQSTYLTPSTCHLQHQQQKDALKHVFLAVGIILLPSLLLFCLMYSFSVCGTRFDVTHLPDTFHLRLTISMALKYDFFWILFIFNVCVHFFSVAGTRFDVIHLPATFHPPLALSTAENMRLNTSFRP